MFSTSPFYCSPFPPFFRPLLKRGLQDNLCKFFYPRCVTVQVTKWLPNNLLCTVSFSHHDAFVPFTVQFGRPIMASEYFLMVQSSKRPIRHYVPIRLTCIKVVNRRDAIIASFYGCEESSGIKQLCGRRPPSCWPRGWLPHFPWRRGREGGGRRRQIPPRF